MLLEPVQIVGGDVGREVVRGRLDGVQPHVGGQVHVVEEVHLGWLGRQVIAIRIGGDAQLEMAGPGPADRRNGPRGRPGRKHAESSRTHKAAFQEVAPG